MTNYLSLPPVVERELRVASRKPATYWGRAGAGAAGVFLVCMVLTMQLASSPLTFLGQITFRLLGGVTAFTVLFSVLRLASEAFAKEKREDTLGLLFLTPLRPVDLVIGKLFSTSLSAFYRFLAIVPMLAVPMLAGGVAVKDFLLLTLALLNLTFLGATIGLWISARCWDEKRAAGWASSIAMILVFAPAAVAFGIFSNTSRAEVLGIAAFSPGFAIWHAVMPSKSDPLMLVASLLWTHLLGWIFFFGACRVLPRCWQKRPDNVAPKGDFSHAPPKVSVVAVPATSSQSNAGLRKATRRQFSTEERGALLARNPFAWFAMRWRPPATATWAIVVIGIIGVVPGVLAGFVANEWNLIVEPGYTLLVAFLINMAIKTLAAHQASFAFARDRGEDTLDLLLSTPGTARQLIDGHVHALRETLRPVVRRALWFESISLVITIGIHIARHEEDTFLYALAGAAMIGMLVPDVRALAWTAIWRSVIKKNAREAEHETFSSIVVLPWMPVLGAWMLGAILFEARGGVVALIISWTVASVIADRHYSKHSRENLETRLTLWAVRRSAGEFEHYDGWKSLGRALGRWWASQRVAKRSAPI